MVTYYDLMHLWLSAIRVPSQLLSQVGCCDGIINKSYIDNFCIVQALTHAANLSVPKCMKNFFKFCWDEECKTLKDESINKHHVWVTAGRPHLLTTCTKRCWESILPHSGNTEQQHLVSHSHLAHNFTLNRLIIDISSSLQQCMVITLVLELTVHLFLILNWLTM